MLDLNELKAGIPAITPVWGSALAEAASVCLETQGHRQGVRLIVTGLIVKDVALSWPATSDQTFRTWADLQEATQFGATAIAVLLAKKEIGYTVIERAVKGTGIDYWLGYETDGPPFQSKARLEVSGILNARESYGSVESGIAKRVGEKIKQSQTSAGSLPAYIIVVEFGRPIAEVQET